MTTEDIRRRLEGVKRGEASTPERAPRPQPPPGGGGRSPYPDYDVTSDDKWAHDWDEKTRKLVLERMNDVPRRSFFDEWEYETLEAACERLLPQDDRPPDIRIPIAPFIDERLAKGKGDGYRYEDMPPDPDAYRKGLRGLDQMAEQMFGAGGFRALSDDAKDEVLAAVERGDVKGDAWEGLPGSKFFKKLLLSDVVKEYYAHPVAWNEIGFRGPASPRGHIRLGLGKRDPWEAEETRPQEQSYDLGGHFDSTSGGGATH